MNIKNKLIGHLRFFLINKLFLLRKEVYYIKWSMNYIKHLELQLETEEDHLHEKDKNQFINDCDLIIDFIEMLDKKIKNILDQISDKSLESKSIIELIILFDCINERINNFILKKFDYVYKSYENLILSYNHLYVPTTSVSKLAKTPNLMLFFNKKLNEISKNFSKLIKGTDSDYKKVFSTWNFIDTDHVADFYETNDRVYLEFSFWLYEMPIFHCIALHEIYHKYYFDDKIIFTENDLNFFKENLPQIIKTDTRLLIDDFSENFIISLYQEILADLHTYIFAKENYIYTLFINGFLVEFNHSFLGIMDPNRNISPDDKCCFNRMEKMSIYNFDFKKKQILYFVRLFFLIKYIEKYDKEVYNSETVQFIIDILHIVFPIEGLRSDYKNFDNFLKDFVSYKMYKKNKYIIEILTEIYYRLFLKNNTFHKVIKRQNEVRDKNYCSKFLDRFNFFKDKFNEINKNNLESQDRDSIQNIYIQLNHDLQEEFRKINIKELKINIDTESKEEKIYFLTNVKIARNNQIDAFILFKNDEIKNKEKIFYSFGPFDFVRLAPKTDNFIDELENELENKIFFIDNHSLFLIKEYGEANIQSNEIFNLMLSIDIKDVFSKEENTKSCTETKQSYTNEEDEKSAEQKTNEQKVVEQINNFFEQEGILQKHQGRLFFSMGNENLVLIIYHIHKDEVEKIIDKFHNINNVSHISSTILLNEKFFLPENKDLILEDLIILVKLKPVTLTERYTKLCEKIKYFNTKWHHSYNQNTDDCNKDNIRLFKKLGVYDAKIIISNISIEDLEILIKDISDLTIDIQIEKEIKVE